MFLIDQPIQFKDVIILKCQFKRSISVICVLLLIFSVLSLSACGQDSDSIVGTWETAPGSSIPIFYRTVGITFYRDGSFTLDCGSYHDDYFIDLDDCHGTYSIIHDGTTIEFDVSGIGSCAYDYNLLSDDRLILKYENSEYILTRTD